MKITRSLKFAAVRSNIQHIKYVDKSGWKKSFIKENYFVSKLIDFVINETTELIILPAMHNAVHSLNEKLQNFKFQQNKTSQCTKWTNASLTITKYLLKWTFGGVKSSECHVFHPSASCSPSDPSKFFKLHTKSRMV